MVECVCGKELLTEEDIHVIISYNNYEVNCGCKFYPPDGFWGRTCSMLTKKIGILNKKLEVFMKELKNCPKCDSININSVWADDDFSDYIYLCNDCESEFDKNYIEIK